jgi:hypothetical protein
MGEIAVTLTNVIVVQDAKLGKLSRHSPVCRALLKNSTPCSA